MRGFPCYRKRGFVTGSWLSSLSLFPFFVPREAKTCGFSSLFARVVAEDDVLFDFLPLESEHMRLRS